VELGGSNESSSSSSTLKTASKNVSLFSELFKNDAKDEEKQAQEEAEMQKSKHWLQRQGKRQQLKRSTSNSILQEDDGSFLQLLGEGSISVGFNVLANREQAKITEHQSLAPLSLFNEDSAQDPFSHTAFFHQNMEEFHELSVAKKSKAASVTKISPTADFTSFFQKVKSGSEAANQAEQEKRVPISLKKSGAFR